MRYFSLELSKKLAAKGLVSESGWHMGVRKHKNSSAVMLGMFTDQQVNYPEEDQYYEVCPAFALSDIILNKDNAIKLWGEKKYEVDCVHQLKRSDCDICKHEGRFKVTHLGWSTQIHMLIDFHLSGGDIEAEVEKYLKAETKSGEIKEVHSPY